MKKIYIVPIILLIIVVLFVIWYFSGSTVPSQGWHGIIRVISSPCEPFSGTPPATGLGPYCKFSFGGAAYQLNVPNNPVQTYMLNFAYGCPPVGSCGPARTMPYDNESVVVTGMSRFDAGVQMYVIDVTSWSPA